MEPFTQADNNFGADQLRGLGASTCCPCSEFSPKGEASSTRVMTFIHCAIHVITKSVSSDSMYSSVVGSGWPFSSVMFHDTSASANADINLSIDDARTVGSSDSGSNVIK